MKKFLTLIAFVSFIATAYSQEIKPFNQTLISKKTPIQIWRIINTDTSYAVVFMNAKYEVLQDQSITILTKAQLKQFASLIERLAAMEPGEYQAKTENGLSIFMDKGEKSYWITIYDAQSRYIKVKSNLINIMLKDISLQ